MALSGAVRHSTKAGRQNKKRQFLILYLSTRYIPILAEESCGALRQGGICQNDRASEGVKKNRAWEQTSCLSSCQRTPRHLNASLSCLWIGTRTVINIYNSLSFPTSLPPFAVFFSFFFFSNPPARYLPFVFFALLITFVSIIFSFQRTCTSGNTEKLLGIEWNYSSLFPYWNSTIINHSSTELIAPCNTAVVKG